MRKTFGRISGMVAKTKKMFATTNVGYGRTYNGAVTLTSSGHPLVDLFSQVGGSRGKDIRPAIEICHKFDGKLTASLMLWARDCRGGAGERQLFRDYLEWLEQNDQDLAVMLVRSGKVQEVGRWDDLLVFTREPLKAEAFRQIKVALEQASTRGLCAKWMPRQGRVANELASFFGRSVANWRKYLVQKTEVVEQKMCAKEWEAINFSHVPSVASARYQKAFDRHVPEQYQSFKAALVRGDKTVKVNSSVLYPYDVLKSARSGDPTVAQAQWDALPNYLGDHGGMLPLIDVSGSMTMAQVAPSISMLDAAISLGLYIADRQVGKFHDVIMNFSAASELILLRAKTLTRRFDEAAGMNWGGNTNIDAAFQNILNYGRQHNIPDNEMPRTILVISDMEFDSCGRYTQHEKLKRDYENAGYTMPKIVFWCLNARSGNKQTRYNEKNVALVSGFSPAIMRSVLSAKHVDPLSIMMETVGKERYAF